MGRRSAGAALEMSIVRSSGGTDECDGGGVSSLFARRTKSAGRLLGLATPPQGYLVEGLDQLIIAAKYKQRAAEAERKAAVAIENHVRHSNNAAVADVGQHQADLLKMHASHASRAAADKRYYIEELRKIADAEKSVREAECRLAGLYEKKAKISDSLRKGPSGGFLRRRSEDDTLRKQRMLEQVTMDIESAEVRLEETRREMEVIKMLRYRFGMQGIADSAIAYASATAAIFGCFREITEHVPAISTQDVMLMNYEGATTTQNCVSRLRRDLAASATITPPSQLMGAAGRRRSDNHRRHGGASHFPAPPPPLTPPHGASTPPPPYTPTAPTLSELPQPGGATTTVTVAVGETSAGRGTRASPPHFHSIYPKLPPNPYQSRRSGLHS
ncbi:hypothetical protein PFISCL1PPCAC_3211 [Pristionchus fissidentatus]|uniref:Uncharacterized protein n=1 Tax=Pristionchus fissidentatus TaxID=1538716 RepID=A0AAV5UXR9_9BILA|nr:hypothetical protein PFISCL1PPCAC_3211 [Pristionchus fissidentatus]